jgi:hypothetical protein
VLLAALLGAPSPAGAIWIRPDIEDVPVERLVANLERKAAESPRAEVRRNGESEPWYGFEPRPIPYEVQQAATPEQKAAADEHLRESIRWYEEALRLDPESLTAQLGHAWSLEQQGEKERAIAGYRAVIEQAWEKERGLSSGNLGQRFYTVEAARYLIPLLHPDRDRGEIEELRLRVSRLEGLPRPVTPLAVPLHDGLAPGDVPSTSSVTFDGDGSGLRSAWTWIDTRAAWLVRDPGSRGSIESALQLFGSVSFWLFWRDGFAALGALDDDGDREVSGAELRDLALWHDANSNGMSEAGEIRSLAHYGIVALAYRPGAPCNIPGIAGVAPGAVKFSDGRRRDLVDLVMHPARAQ